MIRSFSITFFVSLISIQLIAAEYKLSESTVQVTLTTETSDFYSVHFENPELSPHNIQVDGNAMEIVDLPYEGKLIERGQPILPAVSRFVVVPPDKALELSVSIGASYTIQGSNSPVLFEDVSLNESLSRDSDGQGYYPKVAAEMSEPFIIRGVRLVKITTYPVQYEESTNTYLIRVC